MSRFLLGPEAEFSAGKMHPVRVDGDPYIVVRHGSELRAYRDRCSHQDVKLSEFGEIDAAGSIVCFAHGAKFDCLSGAALCRPATVALEPLSLRIEAGSVWAELED